ncbi:MAG: hypothetical protein KJ712_06420, partial [Bacteroidetes bacterium]|nr:hypothetical protein [Bacteroidota bacterium]
MKDSLAYNFIIKDPLYKKIDISSISNSDIVDILFYQGSIDSFCPECNDLSIFTINHDFQKEQHMINLQMSISSPKNHKSSKLFEYSEIYTLEFHCSRNKLHHLNIIYKVEKQTISKIGQSPSLFELQRGEFKKYKFILGNSYNDLYNAVMFYSSHFGVASFAHLRRIVENYFLDKAYQKCKDLSDWDDRKYKESRFSEKLSLLKDELPETLVENQRLYSIISKGIHELNEDECLLYFSAVKECIFLSLDDIIEQNNRKKAKVNIK